jgi:hypothetical protein
MASIGVRIAKLAAIAAGWLVVVATTTRNEPVEHTDLDVELSVGPAAPSTAIVDVTFEGAFIDELNTVCAFDRGGAGVSRDQVGVAFEVLDRLGDTRVQASVGRLTPLESPLALAYINEGCVQVMCGRAEPCGARLAVTVTDASPPDAGLEPEALAPFPVVIAAITAANPGTLPGNATVVLVGTQP